uniref:Uncharacterized protein n=1 Tax=Panagrellus redivivus TaxID=6233 RepID=A0A7E4W5T3_PANRE
MVDVLCRPPVVAARSFVSGILCDDDRFVLFLPTISPTTSIAMDFLHASINAALKDTTPTQSFDGDDEESSLNFEENEDAFNSYVGADFSGAFSSADTDTGGGVTEGDSPGAEDDDQPPELEESNALSGLSQVMTSNPPTMARAYQEDVIPMEKCHFNGNRFTIEGCKYEFVRLNVRNNIYFRCVQCYAIYQRCRSISSRLNANQQIPSVGSLKLVTATNEIRGNPDRPSGIAHCCESEIFRDAMKNTKANEAKANEALKIINNAIAANGVNNNEPEDYVVPLDKCHFLEKRLEIDGCKYVFSRTQSGPRDYYRCSACIALYHKRHFRKLPTPKIGSLSLVRETNILTGDPQKPRGLPHICDNPDLHCPPLRGDGRPKFRNSAPLSHALNGIFEAANIQGWNGQIRPTWTPLAGLPVNGNAAPGSLAAIRPPKQEVQSQSMQMAQVLKRNIDLLNGLPDANPSKYRKLFDNVLTPSNGNTKFNLNGINGTANNSNLMNGRCNNSASPSVTSNGATRSDADSEGFYPHTDDVQSCPPLSFPDGDLSFLRRQELWNAVLSQFPNQPKQGRVLIFSDSLLAEFDNKPLNPSTSLIRAAHPVTPSHLSTLAVKAATTSDCFSKTKYIFYALGYDTIRCLDLPDLTRKINLIQNEFLELRNYLDPGCKARGVDTVLAFVTVPEIGVLSSELKNLNESMRQMIHSLNRSDVVVCDWADIYEHDSTALESVQDRIKRLLVQMSTMSGTELLDED